MHSNNNPKYLSHLCYSSSKGSGDHGAGISSQETVSSGWIWGKEISFTDRVVRLSWFRPGDEERERAGSGSGGFPAESQPSPELLTWLNFLWWASSSRQFGPALQKCRVFFPLLVWLLISTFLCLSCFLSQQHLILLLSFFPSGDDQSSSVFVQAEISWW